MIKKICFIAQFPPPIHGLSKAVDTLYNSELAQEFDFEKIDIKNNKKILKTLNSIRKSKADLFYFTISQSIGGNLRDLLILKAIGKRDCLVHLHGGYYRNLVDKDMTRLQRQMNYKAISKVKGAIVLGPSLKWIFKDMLPDKKIITVPNCVDDNYLMSDFEFETKQNNLPERKIKHVLYLSNFIREKGYIEVLKLATLEKKYGDKRNFHFDFAGCFFDKKEELFFRNYIKKNELEEYVSYHGIVNGESKRKLLYKCDIFCLLSTYPNEGQPISILEAMGNGMIVVTTNHAGIPDLVTDGKNGIVVDKKNIKARDIYNRLLRLQDYNKIEETNRITVKSFFNQNMYISRMKKCFIEY